MICYLLKLSLEKLSDSASSKKIHATECIPPSILYKKKEKEKKSLKQYVMQLSIFLPCQGLFVMKFSNNFFSSFSIIRYQIYLK